MILIQYCVQDAVSWSRNLLMNRGKAARRDDNEEEEDIDEDEDLSLGAAIRESWEHEQHSTQAAGGKTSKSGDRKALQRGYFSDEDASDWICVVSRLWAPGTVVVYM